MMRAKIGQKLKRVWPPLEWFQTFRIFTDKNKNTLIKRGKSEGGTHHKIMKQLKGGAADWTQVLGPVPFAFQLSTVAHAGLPRRLYAGLDQSQAAISHNKLSRALSRGLWGGDPIVLLQSQNGASFHRQSTPRTEEAADLGAGQELSFA